MLDHNGFVAWIVSDGVVLQEYLPSVDSNTRTVSCWINGEVGKTFEVYWTDKGSSIYTCAYITLDGFQVPGRFLYGQGTACRGGVRRSKVTEVPFVFSKVEEDRESTEASRGGNTGMISLKVKKIRVGSAEPPNKIIEVPSASVGAPADLCIRYGEERLTYEQWPCTWHIEPHDPEDPGPSVTFIFRYRTKEFLTSQGILIDEKISKRPMQWKPPTRRVVSAPIRLSEASSVSSTQSDDSDRRHLSRISPALRQALLPGESRPARKLRTTSMREIGIRDKQSISQKHSLSGISVSEPSDTALKDSASKDSPASV